MPKGSPFIVEVEAMERVSITTHANTVGTASLIDLKLPEVERLGLHFAGIGAVGRTEMQTTNFRWKLVFNSSYDGRNWGTPVDIGEFTGASADQALTEYTTTSSFNRHMRFAIMCYNSSGTNPERATISLTLVFRLKS